MMPAGWVKICSEGVACEGEGRERDQLDEVVRGREKRSGLSPQRGKGGRTAVPFLKASMLRHVFSTVSSE